MHSSGNYSAWLVLCGTLVALGEAGKGKWEEGGSRISIKTTVKTTLAERD